MADSRVRPVLLEEAKHDMTAFQKLKAKMANSPIVTAGIGGGLGVLSYMLYGLKNKPANQKMSVYLIHTRLGVQGTVIGMLTVGMIYHVWTDQISPRLALPMAKEEDD